MHFIDQRTSSLSDAYTFFSGHLFGQADSIGDLLAVKEVSGTSFNQQVSTSEQTGVFYSLLLRVMQAVHCTVQSVSYTAQILNIYLGLIVIPSKLSRP